MLGKDLTLDGLVGQLTTFELRNYDNNIVKMGNAFKSSLTIINTKKEKKSKEESQFESEDDLDDLEVFLGRRLSRGKSKYKGKLPLICFKCNEFGHFFAKFPNKIKIHTNDKNDFKYKKNKDYKDKEKKSCYIVEEENFQSSSDDDKEVFKMVYVAIKEDPNGERYYFGFTTHAPF